MKPTLADAEQQRVPHRDASPAAASPRAGVDQPAQAKMGLQRRAPGMLRRHLTRHVLRIAVLLATDLTSFGLLREFYRLLAQDQVVGSLISASVRALIPTGYLDGWQYATALVLGLLVTGNYGSGDLRRDPARIAAGCALATALPLWSPVWERGIGLVVAQFAVTTMLVSLGIVAARLAVEAVDARVIGRRPASSRTILVGSAPECRDLARRSAFAHRGEHALLGFVDGASPPTADSLGHVVNLPTLLAEQRVETVVLCGHMSDEVLHDVVDHSITARCHVFAVPRAFEVAGVEPGVVWKRGQPLVELAGQTLKAQQFAVKRVVDLGGALLGLVLLSPVFALLALVIRMDSRGPVLFRQRRAGIGGKPFQMLKLRTMRDGTDGLKEALAHLNHSGDPRLFKIMEDPRVTRVGSWLRRWSLDELPQLWNVLRGEMSLVGPRPFFESDLDYYEIHHFGRLGAKPGITGLWQVSGRSDIVDFEEVVALDTRYVREWSLLLDLEILARTIPAVVRRKGAA